MSREYTRKHWIPIQGSNKRWTGVPLGGLQQKQRVEKSMLASLFCPILRKKTREPENRGHIQLISSISLFESSLSPSDAALNERRSLHHTSLTNYKLIFLSIVNF